MAYLVRAGSTVDVNELQFIVGFVVVDDDDVAVVVVLVLVLFSSSPRSPLHSVQHTDRQSSASVEITCRGG